MKQKLPSEINLSGTRIHLIAGNLEREIIYNKGQIFTNQLQIADSGALNGFGKEISFRLTWADPNERPRGLFPHQGGEITQNNSDQQGTDGLSVKKAGIAVVNRSAIEWKNPLIVSGGEISQNLSNVNANVINLPDSESKKIVSITFNPARDGQKIPLLIEIWYEINSEFPAIRKRLFITNQGTDWVKIDRLSIDDLEIKPSFRHRKNYTPDERGACASVLGFSNRNRTRGIILGSEIPSVLRSIEKSGAMGYNSKYFEWVLGPSELFESEPVFHYGFSGNREIYGTHISDAMDRSVESGLQTYLKEVVGIRADPKNLPMPLWCTWSNFVANIDDKIIREQARLASACGFQGFQIDAGWSESDNPSDWTCGSRIPHAKKFPDFKATCSYVRDQGLELGLWLSCFRNLQSPDLHDMPDALSIPKVKRGEGLGMSFASAWKDYYANDIVFLAKEFGARYFKQDLTNLKYGDIAEGHESRTRKESYLRAIRGFFHSQDVVYKNSPEVVTLLSHELYWGTPGVPCDIAALKHCWSFHIPPNDYSGVGTRHERAPDLKANPKKLSKYKVGVLNGCFHARKRYYAHRGLPLYGIEYFGAATVNADGSLTSEIQDRQICSWLSGTQSVYAGDLSSLTPDNIVHYRKRFELVRFLQEKYNIFGYFQFSGVPSPTDFGWHWWGKLNKRTYGVVVAVRGRWGLPSKKIRIPWVIPTLKYEVVTHLNEHVLGVFTGEELRHGKIKLSLPRLGQEILELRPVPLS